MTNKQLNIHESVTVSEIVGAAPLSSKEEARSFLEKCMKEETQMVRGIFQNFETPGGNQCIQVRKYKGHFFNQILEDGKEYDIPLYVARHLNGIDITARAIGGKLGTCSYEVHSHLMDANGVPVISHNNRKKRFGFQSLQFAGSLDGQ